MIACVLRVLGVSGSVCKCNLIQVCLSICNGSVMSGFSFEAKLALTEAYDSSIEINSKK